MKEQVETRELKEGRYVIIDDEPCVIKSIAKSKPGKHGAAKARVDAVGIFDGQKRSIVQPVTAKVYVPIVERKSGQVLTIGETSAQLMDLGDYSTIDVPITESDREKLEEGKEVPYLLVMGKTKMDMR
ncbi:MAG: translation initiation factor IF-5A [Methanothrix sp.]|jgi:translation initiation factor 5A (eIF-5A)|uniref:Translation initiation factor 5A n=1 Tax=Methanothrix harundinacea TaxID=301375 RepID=A0A101ILK4_9EURY|nr:MAG: translation initiation factor 5A [Methanosaeta sp. SDB]KUK45155.1 MAG: Translation initiation factor 5A [Methanothrix harundinacea]MDD2638732.1 translation initiation factor IF-5A [Methanothrix sp.]MDI9398584.1 translation initiation factor IF-5A [Euryarchaeota archaeon]KUK97460.1 MAG: Translation initiation factor 5A [Methanothrix harundinacea]